MEELKAKAKEEKLWNLFLPKETDQGRFGAGRFMTHLSVDVSAS
jgi:hypothetical protein